MAKALGGSGSPFPPVTPDLPRAFVAASQGNSSTNRLANWKVVQSAKSQLWKEQGPFQERLVQGLRVVLPNHFEMGRRLVGSRRPHGKSSC